MRPYTTITSGKLTGGAVTVRPEPLLPYGGYSMIQNLRNEGPGFSTRKGQRKLHVTSDGTNKVLSLYQFRKARTDEIRFYAQMSDGDILEASDLPPAVSVGVFGTEVFDGGANQVPASWANIQDRLLMANGIDQHQIYGGNTSRIDSLIVYKGIAAPGTIPVDGEDYSIEVTDGQSTTAAILDSLDTYANTECVFIKSPVPIKSFTPTIKAANGNTSVMDVRYWKSNNTWTSVSGLFDGSSSGVATLAQTGAISFTAPTDMISKYQYGTCGFWYQLRFSAQLDAQVEISDVIFDSDFQDITNLWDGVPIAGIEVQVEGTSTYSVYGAGAVDIGSVVAGKKIMIACADPIEGIYIDPGATPNATGTSITSLKYWDGAAFQSVGTTTDDTSGMSSAGWVTFPRQSDVQPRQFNASQYYAYWYELILDSEITADTIISILYAPYFDIEELGKSQTVTAWKDRAVYSFDRWGEYLYVSKSGAPLVLNGTDYGILKAGDGRSNKVVAQRKFHNELMVWQEEKGTEGGCLTLFEGYSPFTFGKLLLSPRIGCMNSKCVTVIDGVLTATATDETIKTLAFFLSRYGVCVSDGRTVNVISDDIQNYFDPDESECIRYGYESEMWLEHDSSVDAIRVGLVSGDSATLPNVFPVYDIKSRTWSFDSLGQELSCLLNIEADSGNVPVIQVGGGIDDGFVYQSNYGKNDVGTAIDAYFQMELNANGEKLHLEEFLLRAQAQNNTEVSLIAEKNGDELFTKPLSLSYQSPKQLVVDHRFHLNIDSRHISIKLRQNAKDESMYLYAMGLKTSIWDKA